jgi:hypothetical protein
MRVIKSIKIVETVISIHQAAKDSKVIELEPGDVYPVKWDVDGPGVSRGAVGLAFAVGLLSAGNAEVGEYWDEDEGAQSVPSILVPNRGTIVGANMMHVSR